jgi:hypothetical protein
MAQPFKKYFGIFLSIGYYLLVVFPLVVSAAQVTLQWHPNGETPDGYNLYQRLDSQSYDFHHPINDAPILDTKFTVSGLIEGRTYHFVIRAVAGDIESGNSNEATYTVPLSDPDSDNDGYPDSVDAFPHDHAEWQDTDGDGMGNRSDLDDDNDGMPDAWELHYGMDPLDSTDGVGDLDGDGISNAEEYANNTDPSVFPGNRSPAQPRLMEPVDGAVDVDLTPLLKTTAYHDPDGHAHNRTRYQIATSTDWESDLVFQGEFASHLTSLTLGDLILDPESTYFWRVKFYDEQNGQSEWSTASTFTTIDLHSAGMEDQDGDGILDTQEVTAEQIYPDFGDTADMVVVGTGDEINPQLAVLLSSSADLIMIRAADPNGVEVGSDANRPEVMTGVISFKLGLINGSSSASVTVNLSAPAPEGAVWYKYNIENGWAPYDGVSFSRDRKSVTIHLVDGGPGDDDGVRNGVIVDPSGLGYRAFDSGSSYGAQTDVSYGARGFAGVCLISAPLGEMPINSRHGQVALLLMIIGTVAMIKMNHRK